ncbi:MAG: SH3 domain-containing protein [Spirochaetaceae bacterium]|jgi:hypothetical protein|nr:SH3 domain-containing protein [Spirochaetaceae bacterium]
MIVAKQRPVYLFFILGLSLVLLGTLASCERRLGWGLLLWTQENPEIPSGAVLPVFIRSNIDRVWVAGIPEEYRQPGNDIDKIEIPLSQLELIGSHGAANKRAEHFAPYALSYAETVQDGLPMRRDPDNSSQRVYRLKKGQLLKILSVAKGNAAVGADGKPLPGDWYQVLTEDGVRGYCFSYRLRLFDYERGSMLSETAAETGLTNSSGQHDTLLDETLAKIWYPESYGSMVSQQKIDLATLQKGWRFFPGETEGKARIFDDTIDKTFSYTNIKKDPSVVNGRTWLFDGSSLSMTLRGSKTLALQYSDENGMLKSLLWTTLDQPLEDIINQETERRRVLYQTLHDQGPVLRSSNYGELSLAALGDDALEGHFSWRGYNLLSPAIIPYSALPSGSINMGYFLDPSLQGLFTGALAFNFDSIGNKGSHAVFMYNFESNGIRFEYAPPDNLEGWTITRRAATPTVIYFSRN